MTSWYTGLDKIELDDVEIDFKTSGNRCVNCEHNNQGFCNKHNKWAHSLNTCENDRKEQRMTVSNTTGVTARGNQYYAHVTVDSKYTYVGCYKSIKEAVKGIADFEIKYYGYRVRNLEWEV